jgi:hypothetical protein
MGFGGLVGIRLNIETWVTGKGGTKKCVGGGTKKRGMGAAEF